MDKRLQRLLAGDDIELSPETEKQLKELNAEWLKKAKANAKKSS